MMMMMMMMMMTGEDRNECEDESQDGYSDLRAISAMSTIRVIRMMIKMMDDGDGDSGRSGHVGDENDDGDDDGHSDHDDEMRTGGSPGNPFGDIFGPLSGVKTLLLPRFSHRRASSTMLLEHFHSCSTRQPAFTMKNRCFDSIV